jgi:tetratricopeptide (TPR) repeat protein
MSRRKRARRTAEALPLQTAAASVAPAARAVSRRKLWLVRVALALLAPAAFFALGEAALRLGGYGYPTSFLTPSRINDEDVWIPNRQFALRFFAPGFARQPASFAIPLMKADDVVRIFVLGESAAYGDPQPEFGLPRMLQAMLSLRYPGKRFEVVNAAMTGINSHTVLPIARDCAQADGDAWVIYMGNNEVVGPFGAGTVFGPQSPSGALIHASLAIKSTRVGQLLAAIEQRIHEPPVSKSQWGGMLMFVGNQVRSDDARMTRVYEHFEQNLAELLDVAEDHGVAAVVSTVAVNLKDCAPFASLHRPSLIDDELVEWQQHFTVGLAAQHAGDHARAISAFRDAEEIDDSFAELSFALARSLLAVGERDEAARYFGAARDQDVLRFRCDGALNDITRRVAAEQESHGVRLVDAARAFENASQVVAPGAEFFHEHVHLTIEGNYLLARTIAQELATALADKLPPGSEEASPWPSADQCARRLAWTDWHRLSGTNDVIGRLSDPPFTHQSNHAEQVERLRRLSQELRPRIPQVFEEAPKLFEAAVGAAPNDDVLYGQLGALYGLSGNAPAATAAARRAVELLPINPNHWMLLGASLATEQRFEEAADAFQEAFRLDENNVWALHNLARCYSELNRTDEAIEKCRHAIEINPQFGTAYLELGQLLEEKGRGKEAERNYRLALANRVYRPSELMALARFCEGRGWFDDAADNYLETIKLSPDDPVLRTSAGQCLARVRRVDESIEQFREVVRLMPDVVEARLNLGVALAGAGRASEAIEQFREVLRRDPENAAALQHIEALRGRAPG